MHRKQNTTQMQRRVQWRRRCKRKDCRNSKHTHTHISYEHRISSFCTQTNVLILPSRVKCITRRMCIYIVVTFITTSLLNRFDETINRRKRKKNILYILYLILFVCVCTGGASHGQWNEVSFEYVFAINADWMNTLNLKEKKKKKREKKIVYEWQTRGLRVQWLFVGRQFNVNIKLCMPDATLTHY